MCFSFFFFFLCVCLHVCVCWYTPLCICANGHLCVCVCVYMPILFSCVHSTGQKMESTATDLSRWNLSLPTWRKTSSAEYLGSTMQHGYGDTVGSCFKEKNTCLEEKSNHLIYGRRLTCSFSALLPFFSFLTCLSFFPAGDHNIQFTLWLHTSHIPLICWPVRSSCAVAIIMFLNYASAPELGLRCDCHESHVFSTARFQVFTSS